MKPHFGTARVESETMVYIHNEERNVEYRILVFHSEDLNLYGWGIFSRATRGFFKSDQWSSCGMAFPEYETGRRAMVAAVNHFNRQMSYG